MLTIPKLVESLADRIERAYRLRQPGWRDFSCAERVWSVAAAILIEAHEQDSSIPIDPELFVACQSISRQWSDPWAELASPRAGRCYRRQVKKMILSLHLEIRREVRRAEAMVRCGNEVESVLLPSNQKLTALGCYIVAHRAGRVDLARQFRRLAEEQHHACPLYREACSGLLADELYPAGHEHPTGSFLSLPMGLRMVPAYLN